MSENFVKYKAYKDAVDLVKKLSKEKILLCETLVSVRSELTSAMSDKDWCKDQICIALHKVTPKEKAN